MKKLIACAFPLALLAVLGLGTGSASAAKPAATLTCTTTVTGGTYGSVVVPDGAVCTLNSVTVAGSVSVGVGSEFYASGGSIGGSVFASAADEVATGTSVGGATPISGNVSVDSTDSVFFDGPIGGNASFTGNGGVVVVPTADIGGNASFIDNSFVVVQVHVSGNIACSGNGTVIDNNLTVGGNASGQCA